MGFKIDKIFLLLVLVLLQSCSGGRIGNFLESSFQNIKEPKIKEETKNNLNSRIQIKSEENIEKSKNLKEPKIKEETKNNLKNRIQIKSENDIEKSKNVKEPKIKKDNKNNLNNKILTMSEDKSKIKEKPKKKNRSSQKEKYKPQSYKIIFILKDVDPKDPIKELSTILRNSDVNFEIEKIERFVNLKNKSIKKN